MVWPQPSRAGSNSGPAPPGHGVPPAALSPGRVLEHLGQPCPPRPKPSLGARLGRGPGVRPADKEGEASAHRADETRAKKQSHFKTAINFLSLDNLFN